MSVTVIIPSTCERARVDSLERALRSVVERIPDGGVILVIANGERVDEQVLDLVRTFPNTRIERVPEGNVAQAQRIGRSLVATEFFCFLDDDDEYLPGALAARLTVMVGDPGVDVVVTNGFEIANGVDALRVKDPDRVAADPLRALGFENWLASCAGMFRSDRVPIEYFDGVTRYFEWTLLAYKLASTRRVAFIDVPTFRVHDSPGSSSKSPAYAVAVVDVLQRIIALDLPSDVERRLRVKIGAAHHSLAGQYLGRGRRVAALSHHLRSLAAPGGLSYLAYSRKLLPFWPRRQVPKS